MASRIFLRVSWTLTIEWMDAAAAAVVFVQMLFAQIQLRGYKVSQVTGDTFFKVLGAKWAPNYIKIYMIFTPHNDIYF